MIALLRRVRRLLWVVGVGVLALRANDIVNAAIGALLVG